MTTASQREKRIAELREHARQNFNKIVEGADRDIRSLGWVRVTDPSYHPNRLDRPDLERWDLFFARPWGDFFLILTDYAQEHFYVTEATAKSYARIALKPYEKDLFESWKYKRGERTSPAASRRKF